jgi:hypothetical protein
MEATKPQEPRTYEKIMQFFAEAEQRFVEAELRFANAEKLQAKNDGEISRLTKKVGEITDTLGNYVKEQVRPKAIDEFKKFGIELNESYQRVSNDEKGKNSYEIDLLLVSTNYAVAIENKSKLKIDDVNDHLKRLEKIKENPSKVLKSIEL